MMRLIASLLCVVLLAGQAIASVVYVGTPGQTVYVRVNLSSTSSMSVALTEGTSEGVGYYTVSDAALVSAGMSSNMGQYTFKVFSGTPSDTAADTLLATGVLPWSGTVEIPPIVHQGGCTFYRTVEVVTSQTVFETYGGLSSSNDYTDWVIVARDASSTDVPKFASARRVVSSASDGGDGIAFTIDSGFAFTLAVGDIIELYPPELEVLTRIPNATAGATGGLFIAGTNAATTITTGLTANITGNITGNLSGSVGSLTTNNDKTGYALSAAGVDAMWDEVISGHITSGSFGLAFSDPATLDDIYSGSDLEADIAAISSPQVLQSTTIATLASQTGFTLSAGSADNDAYNGCTAIFVDQSTAVQKAVGVIDDYVGSTRTVTLAGAPAFTIATGDTIHVISPAGLAEATIVDVGTAATSSEPVEHTSIPNARIFLVKARADGTYGVSGSGRIRMLPGETLWFAVDLKGTQLEPGDLVDSVTAPTVTGAQAANLTVPTYGVFGTLVKFKCVLSGSAATTDTINVKLTITPESGETLFVTVPVTVGS